MAKTVSYRAVPIERLTSALLAGLLAGAETLVVAIDVAKTKMMAGFGRHDGGLVKLVRFESPTETRAFVQLVVDTGAALGVPVEALMEPSGTYGEGLRALLHARGVSVFMLSPQRVHGAREVFDGVPSLHDAKSCVVIAQLHRQGVSRAYVEVSEHRKRLRALCALVPPPRFHLMRYLGVLAGHSSLRAEVVPKKAAAPPESPRQLPPFDQADGSTTSAQSTSKKTAEPSRHPWPWLLQRVFAVDVLKCEKCGGRLRIVEIAKKPDDVARVLGERGYARAPPRPPPIAELPVSPHGQQRLAFK